MSLFIFVLSLISFLKLVSQDEDEVFGAFLNKKPSTQCAGVVKSERSATWKLRKWTKGVGYRTVVMEERSEETANENSEKCVQEELGSQNPSEVPAEVCRDFIIFLIYLMPHMYSYELTEYGRLNVKNFFLSFM